jgi:hypothetical protein
MRTYVEECVAWTTDIVHSSPTSSCLHVLGLNDETLDDPFLFMAVPAAISISPGDRPSSYEHLTTQVQNRAPQIAEVTRRG